MVKTKIKKIYTDNKNRTLASFDYFGKERSLILTEKVKSYHLSVSGKEIIEGSEVEIMRQVKESSKFEFKVIELFSIKKVYS